MAAQDIPVVVALQGITCTGTGAAYSSAYTVPRDQTGLYYKIKASPGNNCRFDGWTVTRISGTWTGPDAELYSASGDTLLIYAPFTDSLDTDDVTIIVSAAFTYTGGGTPATPDMVTVTTAMSGDGLGSVTGAGQYPRNTSYTVAVDVQDGSQLKEWTNTLDSTRPTTASVTRTATADVTWTADVRKVFKVMTGLQTPSSGGLCALNCTAAYSGHVGTGTRRIDFGGFSVSLPYYKFMSGETCTVSLTPGTSGSGASAVFAEVAARVYSAQLMGGASSVTLADYARNGNTVTFKVDQDVQLGFLYLFASAYVKVEPADGRNNSPIQVGGTTPDVTGDYAPGDTISATVDSVQGYAHRSDLFQGAYWRFARAWGPNGSQTGDTASVSLSVPIEGDYTGETSPSSVFSPSAYYGKFAATQYELRLFYVAQVTVSVTMKTYDGNGRLDLVFNGASVATVEDSSTVDTVNGTMQVFGEADDGFFVYGAVRVDGAARTVLYSYPASGGTRSARRQIATIAQADQVPGSTFEYDLWVWPVTTGKIICSDATGEILCGSGGAPMAQYVETQGAS